MKDRVDGSAPGWWQLIPEEVRAALPSVARDDRTSIRTQARVLEGMCPNRDWGQHEAEDLLITWNTWKANLSNLKAFQQAPDLVVAVEFMSVGDGRTPKVCRSRNGLWIPIGEPLIWKNIPPLHWGCRSTLSPIPAFEAKPAKLERARKKLATIQPPAEGFGVLPSGGLDAALRWIERMEGEAPDALPDLVSGEGDLDGHVAEIGRDSKRGAMIDSTPDGQEIPCPACGFMLSADSLKPGDFLDCPDCGERLKVPDNPGGGASGARRHVPGSARRATPRLQPETRTCPYCAEEIKSAAIKCKHCGEMLDGTENHAGRATGMRSVSPSSPVASGFGVVLFLLGLLGLLHFWGMNTTVEVPRRTIMGVEIGGERVHNIGLMQERQNGLILTGGVCVVGLFLAIFAAGRTTDQSVATPQAPLQREEEQEPDPELPEGAVPFDPRTPNLPPAQLEPPPLALWYEGLTPEQKGMLFVGSVLAITCAMIAIAVSLA